MRLLIAVLAVTGCSTARSPASDAAPSHADAAPPAAPAPWVNAFGLISTPQPGVVCFSGRHLEAGFVLTLFAEGQQPVAIASSTGQPCPDEPEGRSVDEALWHRTLLEITGNRWPEIGLGIGLADPREQFLLSEDTLEVDVDGDGAPESFAQCTSSEGVHLTVWSGEPRTGTRLWHTYYYLDYDTEADCTEAEWAPVD